MDEYEQALRKAIIEYIQREYDESYEDIEDPYEVGLLYTTVDDYNYREHDLQIDADVVNHRLHYYLDGALIHSSQLASASSMWAFMSDIDFQTLYEIAMPYVISYDPTIL